MNHFFAIEVPQEVRQYIQERIVALWKPALRENPSWCPPEDYHVTLKFLGNVAEERVEGIIAAAVPIAAQTTPFDLTLAPPGAFPTGRSKRVFWMGVGRDGGINALAASLDRTCGEMGFKREDRIYTPHITVARTPRGGGRDSESCAPTVDERLFPSWRVTRFVLMQTLPPESRVNGTKARYNSVHTFPFGGAHSSDVS